MNIIILAGGLGTRLQSIVKDVPKPMADIDGVPFLELLIRELLFCDPEKIILCVSHLKDIIERYFGNNFLGVPIVYSEELEPLGTGGAIRQAFELYDLEEALVLNGDSYVQINYQRFIEENNGRKLAVVLKHVINANRYGQAQVKDGHIVSFCEKSDVPVSGLINAGIYILNRSIFSEGLPMKFSFEKDLLERKIGKLMPSYHIADNYFIDIGIPESYSRAKRELKSIILGNPTRKVLFLDRDGVINIDKHHLYKIEDCEFIPGIFDLCNDYQKRGFSIVVITNQAGIGKGIYTESDYFMLREYIHQEFAKRDINILGEYFCPYHPAGIGKYRKASFYRKPNPGMILLAAKDLNINLTDSVFIGDKETDRMAARLGGVGKFLFMRNSRVF